jgi:hypothetical protein
LEHDVHKRLARHVELRGFDAVASVHDIRDAPAKTAHVFMWLRDGVADMRDLKAELFIEILP